jgi:hypothetical protein
MDRRIGGHLTLHRFGQDDRQLGGDHGLTADDIVQRPDQVVRFHVLEQITSCPSLQRVDHVRLFTARGQHDYRHTDLAAPQLAQDLESIHARHAHVEQHDVRLFFLHPLDALLAIAERANHLYAAPLQQFAKSHSEQRMIIDHQHPHQMIQRLSNPRSPGFG